MDIKIYAANDLQSRILERACQLDCQNIEKAKQGKALKSIEHAVFELVFIAKFMPYWNAKQRKQKEIYLKEKFNI